MKTTSSPVLAALLAAGLLTAPARADQKTKTLDLYWIDSEGGGSTLIVTPAGESVLVDTGNPGWRDPARIVAAAKAAGLTKIDHVLLTHFHIDHFGGGAEVAQSVPFGTIHQRTIPAGDPDGRAQSSFPMQIKGWKDIAASRATLAPGVAIPLRQGGAGAPKLELMCLAADQKFIEPTAAQAKVKNPLTGSVPAKAVDSSDNANSAVFLLSFGGFRFFDGGDLTWNLEEKLVTPVNLPGVVDVYQTNHHGLAQSNNPALVQSLEPTVVIMNNGPQKGGEAGSFAAIRSAKSVQATYQLHESFKSPADNGPKEMIANDGNRVGAEAAKCPANVIKLSVAPDGKSYTVSIPSNGHAKTYQTKG
ncbi:MAG: MBL fold metallo-hydrolase [Verrucomicrobia bacterium]|nr:MBL fold metallo-hydrolase [Verrucomicrobiota bacterium]